MALKQLFPRFSLVVAATEAGGIGNGGTLPWKRLREDMARFKSVTCSATDNKRNCVIMGRNTWESIPAKFRPLPDRLNIVLSRSADARERASGTEGNVLAFESFEASLAHLAEHAEELRVESVFVIGGAGLFESCLAHPLCDRVYLTRVYRHFECDTFIQLPSEETFAVEEEDAEQSTSQDDAIPYRFSTLRRRNLEERQYLAAVSRIIDEGNVRGDRTGVGTHSIFGMQMRYNLEYEFPLLTTKRVFWRGLAQELLWFVAGSTDAKLLSEQGVRIWDGNGSREFLDQRGLQHYEEGELGPVYGFQWRHFGAAYKGAHADYTGQGVDQLANVIDTIKNNPTDRRIIMSAWNPADLEKMALPPCHMFCQFYVHDGKLSCQMYQRSCDMGLGVPFNIASYALLTCMVAHVCDLTPGEFVHTLGDAHVYRNHVEPLKEQLTREPRPFPRLRIKRRVPDIDSFKFEDFELVGYKPHPTIKMQMAV
eukprot:TRINITY_DN7374_c0_g1_i1.p1 TRINITY_DN7374_c0_g1~~TRINITY_DN7374_c0_g1_i1.p1  ORF type:complete len:502 (+),score=133.92 TRINITY_DN7374_c0_g1_i1:64-1506(+)